MTAGTDNQFSCCFSVDDESSERNQNHSRNGNGKLSVETSLILEWIEQDGSWFIELWRAVTLEAREWNEAELRRDRDMSERST